MTNFKLFRTTFITAPNTKDNNLRTNIEYHAKLFQNVSSK